MKFYYYLLILLVLLVLTFPFIVKKLAEQSGWKTLAKKFPSKKDRRQIKGERLKIRSALIGGFSYRNVIRMITTKKGLVIGMTWPFKIGHDSVMIPWREFKELPPAKKGRSKRRQIEIGRPAITILDLSEKDFKELNTIIKNKPRL